jgi:RND family efflux transporter MFP subunit
MPINTSKSAGTRSKRTALIAVLVVAAVVAAGLASRRSNANKLGQEAASRAIPTVSLLVPAQAAAGALELPARVDPWSRAPIYARVSGYLASWNADIGSKVKAGQLLARIDTPDLDQQLLQAQAELASSRSGVALAASTARRWNALLAEDAVSRQEVDERSGDLAAKQAAVQAAQANVQRIQAMQRYTRLVAPFDGVVTARNTDVGALINAGGNVGGGAGTELFVVSDVRKLRVYVQVPQRQLAMIGAGSTALLTVPERPGQRYKATVQSMSQAISSATGAMLVQLSVDNASGELLPGAFATVRFETPSHDGVSVPPGALITGKNGVQVATVDAGNRVRLKSVTVARDLGSVIQLAGGVLASDRIIDSPPDGIGDGEQVRIAAVDTKSDKKVAP